MEARAGLVQITHSWAVDGLWKGVALNYGWSLFILNPRALETAVDHVYTHPRIQTFMTLMGRKEAGKGRKKKVCPVFITETVMMIGQLEGLLVQLLPRDDYIWLCV